MGENPRVITTAPWLIGVTALAEMLFTAGAVVLFVLQGPGPWAFVLVGLALAASLAVAEAVISRVVLTDDALEIRSLRGRTTVPVEEIRRVKWEGGSGVAVRRATGTWVKLPSLGRDAQGVTNTVRAWLRARGVET